jgi:hypothetical protein
VLVEFIGAPGSGKTTTAAQVFAQLKDEGSPAEFVAEQARLYIAERRFAGHLEPDDPVVLDDRDQFEIMKRQLRDEYVFKTVCGPEVVIISDSSPISALLYMTDVARTGALSGSNRPAWEMVEDSVGLADIVFYAHSISRFALHDPNRIHTPEQSLAIDARIPGLLDAVGIMGIPLVGIATQRFAVAMREINARRR